MRIQRTTEESINYLRTCGPTCSPGQLALAIGGNPNGFTVMAKKGELDYEFTWHGRNLRIYTESVIKRLEGN